MAFGQYDNMTQTGNQWQLTNPVGYQGPDISAPGFPVVTKDQQNQKGAPAGYQWDPVKQQYIRTPGSLGADVNAFTQGALPGLTGALTGALGGASGAGGASGGFGAAAGGATPGTGGAGAGYGGANIPAVSLPSQQAASEAAFATEKDRAGKIARAGLTSLRDELGSTGALGGGAEVQGTRDIIQGGQGIMGQANRDIAMKDADLAADFAKTGYQGAITQRGQDVSAQEAQARLAQERELQASRLSFEQQQLASQRQMQLMQMALGGLKGLPGMSGNGVPGLSY